MRRTSPPPACTQGRTALRLAAALLLLAGGAAQAQDRRASAVTAAPGASIDLLPSRAIPSPALAASLTSVERPVERATEPAPIEPRRSMFAAGSSLSRASLVQMPAENVVPGRYARPRYALGFRSSTMKSLVQGMGLDAEHCLAPLVRARLTMSQDGRDAGGRVMVFARCTLR